MLQSHTARSLSITSTLADRQSGRIPNSRFQIVYSEFRFRYCAQIMLVLGSASPRRAELLRQLGVEFVVCASDVPEEALPNEDGVTFALRLARGKAKAVARVRPGSWVLGADTVVLLDGEILGKPVDAEDARNMLRRLSGRGHRVVTGFALVAPLGDVAHDEAVESRVEFRSLGEAEIDAYVTSGESLDKAGAYGIQGGASAFVERVSGSYSNVVGLPLEEVRRVLEGRGLLAERGGRGDGRRG
jgi:septum formation protein